MMILKKGKVSNDCYDFLFFCGIQIRLKTERINIPEAVILYDMQSYTQAPYRRPASIEREVEAGAHALVIIVWRLSPTSSARSVDNGHKVIVGQPNHGRLHAHVGTHQRPFSKRECWPEIGRERQAPLLERFVQDADALKELRLRLAVCHRRIESVVGPRLELGEEEIPRVHGDCVASQIGDDKTLDVAVFHHRVVRRERKVAVEI